MNDILTFVVGTITGSFGTTIFSKWYDKKEKEVEYKRDLDKTYFLAKLKAATELYAQFTQLHGSLHHTILLFGTIRDPTNIPTDQTASKAIQDNLAEHVKKNLAKSEELSTAAANSFGLFFSLPDDEAFMKATEEIHKMGSALDGVQNNFIIAENYFLDPALPENLRAEVQTEYYLSIENYTRAIDNITEKYREVLRFVQARLKRLHDYYKKYDNY